MKFDGVYVPVITPVNDNEEVDEASFRKLINHSIEGGVGGIIAAGSNGDCLALTQIQRDNAIRIAVDECANRVPVVAGVMDSSTRRVVDNIKKLEQFGGTNAIVTPIFYARHLSPDETVRMFEELSRKTDANLFIYNIPIFTQCLLKPKTIFEIAKIDKVVGYKDSTGILDDFLACLDHFRGTDFGLFQGITGHMVASALLGSRGCTPVLACIFPQIFVKLHAACVREDLQTVAALNPLMRSTQKLLGLSKNPAAIVKYLASLQFGSNKVVLSPQESLTSEEEIIISKRYHEISELLVDVG